MKKTIEKPQHSRIIESTNNSKSPIQRYLPTDFHRPLTKHKIDAETELAKFRLAGNGYFHCTKLKNAYSIKESGGIEASRGGQNGAGRALGGPLSRNFQINDRGFAFASKEPSVISEYYELFLAKAIESFNVNMQETPLVIAVSAKDGDNLQPDIQQQGAMKSRNGFDFVQLTKRFFPDEKFVLR